MLILAIISLNTKRFHPMTYKKNETKELIEQIKYLENELRSSKATQAEYEMLKNIIKYSPDWIYWKDKNSVHLGSNEQFAKAAGLSSSQEMVGKTDYDLPWCERAQKYRLDDQEVIVSGTPKINIEDKVLVCDKKEVIVISNKVPLKNAQGDIIGILGIATDITNQKKTAQDLEKAKEAAEAANIAKTIFISNISHDIRTPLSAIIGLSHIIENSENDPELKIHAHHIAQSANELLNMSNQVITAISSNRLTVDDVCSEPFDLKHLVEAIINLESPPADLKHIQLATYIDDKIPNLLVGDHDKIYHIILNLVGNALKFTKNGQVKISITLAKKESKSVLLDFEVSDTGMGIPAEDLDKVFDMFYKATPSYKGKDQGHGIGLYIVKSYTELLGGKVSVESKLNEGTKFTFTLRLDIAESNAIPQNIIQHQPVVQSDINTKPIKQRETAENPQHTPQILAIEDNSVMLSVIEALIKEAKCNPTKAEDGESGLELAKNKDFDLILSDLGLPGISGIEFAQKLRRFEKEHNKKPVPIIAVTGHGQSIEKECLEAGINHVILKPLKPEVLHEICDEFALFSDAENNPPSLDKAALKSANPQNHDALGPDLPNTEAALFDIDALPLFDMEEAQKLLANNTTLLMKVLRDSINSVIPTELPRLIKAHQDGDWKTVANIAHKLKGGCLSISLTRLGIACQYLERYHQAGLSASLEKLYQQLIKVLDLTIQQIKPWTES